MSTKRMKKIVAAAIVTATVCGMMAGCTSKEEKIEEEMFLGLRLMEGINLEQISKKYSVNVEAIYQEALEKLIQAHDLERVGNQIRLTRQGLLMANDVFEQFLLSI